MHIIEKHNIKGIPALFVYSDKPNDNKHIVWVFHKLLQSKLHELPSSYRLAEENNFVVILDMYGHGERKRKDSKGYNFDYLIKDIYNTASDVSTVLEYLYLRFPMLNYKHMTALGVSIGASIALVSSYLVSEIKTVISLVGVINWEYTIKNNQLSLFKKYSSKKHLNVKELVSMETVKNDIERYDPLNHFNASNLPRILLVNGLLDSPGLITATQEYYEKMKKLYNDYDRKDYLQLKEFSGAGHEVTEEMIRYVIKWMRLIRGKEN